ncbi:MAG: hypothetical protein KC503_19220 [Myxococcales bacterium]|nr:hypothetical protein [Myxococcales bacterium]
MSDKPPAIAPAKTLFDSPEYAAAFSDLPLSDLPADFATRTLIASRTSHGLQIDVKVKAQQVDARFGDERLIMMHEPDSPRAGAFRVLTGRLAERGSPRTVLCTSPLRQEGKTTLAVNLALALCEFGRARVLLIECNLRRPALAKLFGFRPPTCASKLLLLSGHAPTGEWHVAQIKPELHVIAVDTASLDKPHVIDGPSIDSSLRRLKRVQYDYIVLDTPHVLGHADVNLAQDYVDAIVMSGYSKKTSMKAVSRAVDQLSTPKLLGMALVG